jgi:hypothetical protein
MEIHLKVDTEKPEIEIEQDMTELQPGEAGSAELNTAQP